MQNISESVRDRDLLPKDHLKWHMATGMVTRLMTSRDQRDHDTNINMGPIILTTALGAPLQPSLYNQVCISIQTWFQWSTYRK